MFLVHHDQLQAAQRQEDRRTGPDHQLAARRIPQAEVKLRTLAVGEFRMIGDHPLAENLPEPIDQLGRESDLRHEQQHLSAPGQHLGGEVHINFRFTRTGDTPQQHGRAVCKRGTDLLGSLPLRSGKRRQTKLRTAGHRTGCDLPFDTGQ